jgi:hypothetical protein
VLPGVLRHGPTRLCHETRKERKTTLCKLNSYLIFFKICFSIFLSFFSAVGKDVQEQRDIMWEDVGSAGAIDCFIAPWCNNRGGKAAGLHRHSKNGFTRHLTPHTMRPIRRGIQQPYPKRVPRLSWGLPKLRVRR